MNILNKRVERPTSDSREIKQIKPSSTWQTWESTSTRDRSPEICPARCKQTGKCYATAYYQGKASRAKDCERDCCTWEGGNK